MSDLTIQHVISAYAYARVDSYNQLATDAKRMARGQKFAFEFTTLFDQLFKAEKISDETGQLLFFTRNADRAWEGMMNLESFAVVRENMDNAIVTILRGEDQGV